METPSHCTVSARRTPLDLVRLALLSLAVLLVHGYHPWAEDGGLYIAGVEFKLIPSLFPKERAFVTAPLRYSLFAPAIATAVRLSHLSLATVLVCVYLAGTALTLFAALRIAQRCFASQAAQWTAVALLAAWWTLPVAATSLLLMDPYVTARSLSTPLSLLAVSAALEPWRLAPGSNSSPERRFFARPAIRCVLSLILAGLFHPLMAGYALGFVLFLRFVIDHQPAKVWIATTVIVFAAAFALQTLARPESPAAVAAAHSRYYWFLSQWHWFEWLGLLAPLLIFSALLKWAGVWMSTEARALCKACIATALLATAAAVLFAQEHFRAHPIGRFQPLRAFLLIYIIMFLLCGGALASLSSHLAKRSNLRAWRYLSLLVTPGFVLAMAAIMFFVQRASFPNSIHLELPGRANPNPWVQAFLWARDHTPPDALFALDARYINTAGEDAQTFRTIARRSAIPDFSKDGGEAANAPQLAPEWQRSAIATARLSDLSDTERTKHLRSFGVQWLILHSNANTAAPCPYRNPVVKVCQLAMAGE